MTHFLADNVKWVIPMAKAKFKLMRLLIQLFSKTSYNLASHRWGCA